MAQEGMFWELVPEDVMEILAELNSADLGREWRSRKAKMERASGRPWTGFKCSQRTIQKRGYARREFWDFFVDDRPFCRDACFRHANVQSKAVFSDAMTIMDEVCGWEDEEKRVVSKIAACMWIYTKEVLTRGHVPTPKMEEYLKRRLMSIMLCMNWVCAGTFDDHEGVSESTITQHEEEEVMTWDWITKSVFRVWYNGACWGFQRQQG